MTRYLLDTPALLTLRDNEAGADQVTEILYQAQQGKAECFGCFMSLMEVLYRVCSLEQAVFFIAAKVSPA